MGISCLCMICEEALTAFVLSGLPSQPGKTEIAFPSGRETLLITVYYNEDVSLQRQGEACLIPIIKYLGSLSSGYLPEMQPTACIGVTWPLLIAL